MTGFGQSRIAQRRGDVGGEERAPADRAVDAALGLLGQVVARAERPAGTLDDDDADAWVGVGRVEGRDERLDELAGERVELRRTVQDEANAPRGRRRRAGRARRPDRVSRTAISRVLRTTSASTATAPGGDAITGFRSTSRMSGRSDARGAKRDDHRGDSAAVDGRAGRERHRGSAPPRSSSSIASAVAGVERGETDRDVVEHLGEDAAEADEHRGPNCGSRRSRG